MGTWEMAKTLNKQSPFGRIYGDREGRVYVQDGVYFDTHGREWIAGGLRIESKLTDKTDNDVTRVISTTDREGVDDVVVNFEPAAVVNGILSSRKGDRHKDKNARREYLRDYMRKRRHRLRSRQP